jgi:hypothetical protein
MTQELAFFREIVERKQPSRMVPTSQFSSKAISPRVKQSKVFERQLLNREAESMCVPIASTFRVRASFSLRLISAVLLAVSFLIPHSTRAQSVAPASAHSPGWVVISVDDYRALRHRAFPSERDPEPPPVDATLSRVDYDLRINGDLAAGRATLTVDVLKDGWVRVPIPAGLLVREARLDGKLVSLVPATAPNANGQFSALLSHTGRSILILDIALPVSSSPGEESISLPSTPSGITRATVQLPRQGVDVRLGGGFLADKSESADQSKWIAYGHGNDSLSFTWRRKTEDHHASLPLRLRGSFNQLLGLGEDSATLTAEVNLDVVQGAASDAHILVPAGITINQVQGAAVADWEQKSGELAITFLEPVEQSTRFVITGEWRSPRDGLIDIPLLRLPNTERETGGVAVEVLGAGEIKGYKPVGLETADATDLGEMISSRQSPQLAAFRFRSGDAKTSRSLNVNVARYTPQAVLMANIEEARYEVLISNDGKILVLGRYAVRNNQRNFLKVTLPPGATLWSASLSGNPVRPGQAPDGGVLLPLEKAHAGEDAPEFAVELVYLSRSTPWTDKGHLKLSLPALDLPVSRTGLEVHHPPLFKVTSDPGAFTVAQFEEPLSAALNPPPPSPPPPSSGSAGGVGGGVFSSAAPSAITQLPMQGRSVVNMALLTTGQSQKLVDDYKTKSEGGKVRGILPIRVSFPSFGPSIYLVSELTTENQPASADFNFQRDKKAGGK